MSDYTNNEKLDNDKYFHDINHMSDYNDKFIEDNRKLLSKKKEDNIMSKKDKYHILGDGTVWSPSKPQKPKNKKYDPIIDYYEKIGVNQRDSEVSYYTNHVVVNSKDRKITKTIIAENDVNIENKLSIAENTNILTINDPLNEDLEKGDLITISGVNEKTVKLRTTVHNQYVDSAIIDFENAVKYMEIKVTAHGLLPALESYDSSVSGTFIESDYMIQLKSLETTASVSIINNINVVDITEGKFPVFLKYDVGGFDQLQTVLEDSIYIQLPEDFIGDYDDLGYTISGTILRRYLIFNNNSEYMTIVYNHNIVPYQETITDTQGTLIEKLIFMTDAMVEFENIGNASSTHINNIPLNWLNGKCHNVYVINKDVEDPPNPTDDIVDIATDRFYIKLDSDFIGNFTMDSHNITLSFKTLGGIPLDYINVNKFLDFHEINKVNKTGGNITGYDVVLGKKSTIGVTNSGGENIRIGKIKEIVKNNIHPNKYSIDLPHAYVNVIQIKMVNSIFPNTIKTIKKSNNKLYWQNIDDGDKIYSICVPEGYYTTTTLKATIESLVSEVLRVDHVTNDGNTFLKYKPNNKIEIDINYENNITTLHSYKTAELVKPISFIYPPIHSDPNDDEPGLESTNRQITIYHPSHFLNIGDKIKIYGAIDTMGIPKEVINKEHTIIAVSDNDHYTVELDLFVLLTERDNTNGGLQVFVDVDNLFKLHFDYDDTFGDVLGFMDVGDEFSITSYGAEIKNTDIYEDKLKIRELIDPNDIGATIKMRQDEYIIMDLKQVNTIVNTGPVKDNFAIINLDGVPGQMIYNKHSDTPKFYDKPLGEFSRVDVEFYDSDGNLFDFDDRDHSFTLGITTVERRPVNTNIS